MELMSGAGHDCMNFKDVCPTAMIFVPSEGGVSHRKEEFTSRVDCARGAKVLLGLLLETAGVSEEAVAGIATFMTMACVLVVQPGFSG